MPECVVLIRGQQGKYRGGRVYMQEAMPEKLKCMSKAEYEDLRRLVDESLGPLNSAVQRAYRVLRFCCVPTRSCPFVFCICLLPCIPVSMLPELSPEESRLVPACLITGLIALFLAEFALRWRGEAYVDGQVRSAFEATEKACRQFSRRKPFKVGVYCKTFEERVWTCFAQRGEYYLRIVRVKQADFAGSCAGSEPGDDVQWGSHATTLMTDADLADGTWDPACAHQTAEGALRDAVRHGAGPAPGAVAEPDGPQVHFEPAPAPTTL